VGEQSGIWFPGFTAIPAHPQAGWINPSIEGVWLAGPPCFNHPNILQLQSAALWKLDALFGFLPGVPKIITVAYKAAEELSVIRSE
jgi:hypothetical protein